jgi:hypothetical protein
MVQKKGERLVANSLLFLVAAILIYSSANDFNFGGNSITGFQVAGAGLNPVLSPRLIWSFDINSPEWILDLDKVSDVDGDGINDVAVASYTEDHTLYLLSGATGNLIWSYTSSSTSTGISYISSLSDVDGDGFEDIAIGVNGIINDPAKFQVISGLDGTIIWSYTGSQPSVRDVEVISDVTGDGINDVVGGTATSTAPGKVRIFDGVTGTLFWDHEGHPIRDLEAIQDVNGDRVSDVVLGTQGNTGTLAYTNILSGSDGSLVWSQGPHFGWYVEPINQRTGKGQDVLGATPESSTGLYRLDKGSGDILWQFTGACSGEWIGVAEIIPDVTGDGEEDALAATTSVTPFSGCKRKVYGVDGVTGQPIWDVEGSVPGAQPVLFMIDDINGNGLMDVFAVASDVLYAIEGSKGDILWSYPVASGVYSGLAVDDINGNGVNDIVVGGDGVVYAFEGKK